LLQDVHLRCALCARVGIWATAILSCAGIGANTAIFQLVDAVVASCRWASERLAGVQVKNGKRGFGITVTDNETALLSAWSRFDCISSFSNLFAWRTADPLRWGKRRRCGGRVGCVQRRPFNTLEFIRCADVFYYARRSHGLWHAWRRDHTIMAERICRQDGDRSNIIWTAADRSDCVAPRSFFA